MNETKREYLKRIHIVLDFIENNLDSNLSLEYLSQIANYSPFHFHRVFLTVVNERLNEFITRKRIERIASILLVKPNSSLKDLAYTYGFNVNSSFSRTFKKYYGISPTKFKLEGKALLSKIGIAPFSSEAYICSVDTLKQWTKMNAQIELKELTELKLATISHIGNFEKAGEIFQKLMGWGHQKGVLDTSNFKAITLYHDNPNVTHNLKVRFSAGVIITKSIAADGEIRPHNIDKGIYAMGHFEIKGEAIARAWKSMCIWVIENKYEFRDGDYLEVYHNDHKDHPEHKFIMDICIPVHKPEHIEFGEISTLNLSKYKAPKQRCENSLSYHQLISFMEVLRRFFQKEYDTIFKLGKIYKGNPNFSYFSLTTNALKKEKLKFVIILNHKALCFSICLSGQNKSVRKTYWEIFKGSDWKKYHVPESIDDSLSIIDKTIVNNPDFNDETCLIKLIEKEALLFISDIEKLLE